MTNIIELSIPAPDQAVVTDAEKILAAATEYRVTTAQQYADAGEQLKAIKAKYKELDEQRREITKPLDAAKKRAMDFFSKPLDFLTRAESAIKRGMIAFSEEQERIRREEQRKAEEAAQKERDRLAKIAAEAEAKARAEQDRLRREAESAAAAGRAAEAAKLAAQAAKVEEKAAVRAEVMEQRTAAVVAPVIHREPPKVTGVSAREVWKFEVTDATAVPREYMVPDETKIRKVVNALKGDTQIAGVKVWAEKSLAAGRSY